MSKYRILSSLIVSMLILAGCAGNDGTGKPDNLIPADKMADILTEVHLAESQVGRYSLRSSDSSMMLYNRLSDRIYKKFDVDTSAYRMSYIYYSSHPDLLEAIYKDVTADLEKMVSTTASASATSGSATSASATTGSASSGSVMSGTATLPYTRRPKSVTTRL